LKPASLSHHLPALLLWSRKNLRCVDKLNRQ
jgi:hypothetical protein